MSSKEIFPKTHVVKTCAKIPTLVTKYVIAIFLLEKKKNYRFLLKDKEKLFFRFWLSHSLDVVSCLILVSSFILGDNSTYLCCHGENSVIWCLKGISSECHTAGTSWMKGSTHSPIYHKGHGKKEKETKKDKTEQTKTPLQWMALKFYFKHKNFHFM